MMTKTRSSEKEVIHTEEVLDLTEEEVIIIVEVVFVVIFVDVVKKAIDIFNVDLLKVDRITEML